MTNTTNNPFLGLEWPEIGARAKALGFQLADGKSAVGGYYPARQTGGYQRELVPCKESHQVVRGTPAYHGTVAYKL